MYKIEKNVPKPEVGYKRSKKYPLAEMEIGDSFLLPAAEDAKAHARNLLNSVVRHRVLTHPKEQFLVRQVPEGVRVWRVKKDS